MNFTCSYGLKTPVQCCFCLKLPNGTDGFCSKGIDMASVRIGFVKSSGILDSKAKKLGIYISCWINKKVYWIFLCENDLHGDIVVVWLDDADWA